MPYDSEGNFTRIHNWEDDRVNDIEIVTDHHDEEDDNFADALSACFLRDGRSAMRGDINCGGFKVKNLAAGTLPSDAVTRSQLDKSAEDLTTALTAALNKMSALGDIKASLQEENHGNWLLCNGQEVKRTEYSALFELIGTKFGAGDGINTFNVPDYRGKFLRGLGGDSAADVYTTQPEGLPEISGSFYLTGAGGSHGTFSGAFYEEKSSSGYAHGSAGDLTDPVVGFAASRSSEVYGASEHVTPVNQAVNYFIKAKEE